MSPFQQAQIDIVPAYFLQTTQGFLKESTGKLSVGNVWAMTCHFSGISYLY